MLRLWANALPQTHGRRRIEDWLPLELREALPALEAELAGLATLRSAHAGGDGSERLLVTLADGQTVESDAAAARGPVRIDAGRLRGRLRVLHDRPRRPDPPAHERRDRRQVALARQRRAVRWVVFMGMGEPAHNLDAVLDAIELLGTRAASRTSSWCSPRWAMRASSSGCRRGA